MQSSMFMALGFSSLAWVSCGGGGGGSGTLRGQFVDSAVQGLEFEAGTLAGLTDATGTFSYRSGAAVEFSVGDIVLGQGSGADVMTPVSLVLAAVDETDPAVTNIARFLLTLDGDLDPDNGISISSANNAAAIGLSLDFDQTIAEFETDPNVASVLTALGVGPLVSAATAQAHLAGTLLGLHAGRYAGTFTGEDSGPFQCYVDRAGNLLGCGFSNEDQNSFTYSGSLTSDGAGVFGNVSTGASFEGLFEDGSVTGTWVNTVYDISGDFSGNVTHAVAAVLDPAILAQIAGSYAGTYTLGARAGAFSATIGADGSLTIDVSPNDAVGALTFTTASGAAMRGMSDEGTEIVGTITLDGQASGTLSNPHFAESGSFSASLR